MNYLNRILILLLPVLPMFAHAEEETFSLRFDRTAVQSIVDHSQIRYKQLKINNEGNFPLEDCFPSEKASPFIGIDDLKALLKTSNYPVLTLYRFWCESVVKNDTVEPILHLHPLDLVNFSGVCNEEDFQTYFIELCTALDISVRQANMKSGKTGYDFSYKNGEWHYLDLISGTVYPKWDNKTLASSEQIADDPLLALRVRHTDASDLSFDTAWQKLADFEILEPAFAPLLVSHPEPEKAHVKGFTLYPNETLLFTFPEKDSGLHAIVTEHCVVPKNRGFDSRIEYHSPVPLRAIANATDTSLRIEEIDCTLLPGERFEFDSLTYPQKFC